MSIPVSTFGVRSDVQRSLDHEVWTRKFGPRISMPGGRHGR
jgi:hypothetical protein